MSNEFDAASKTANKIVDAISSPVLIFLIVLTAGVIGTLLYTWDKQAERAQEAYLALVDECLPNREKIGFVAPPDLLTGL